MQIVLFYTLGVLAVLLCGAVVLQRNPVYSAMALVAALFLQAGLYAILGATFLAVVQVLVYAGAIMVLFLFVVMMVHIRDEDLERPRLRPVPIIGGAILLMEIAWVIYTSEPAPAEPIGRAYIGGAHEVGVALLRDWAVPFEILSLLLLAAIVGAVTLGRRRLLESPGAAAAAAASENADGSPGEAS